MGWRAEAACAGMDLDEFFGDLDTQHRLANEVCSTCPVLPECAEQGKAETWGLWGGMPEGTPGRRPGGKTRRAPIKDPPKVCTVAGCDRERARSGWCWTHYDRVRKVGDPQPDRPIETPKGEPDCDWWPTVAEVAGKAGLTVSDVLGRSRVRHVVKVRQRAMCRLYAEGWSLSAIGRLFDRDHSTVHYAVSKEGEAA